MISFSKFFPSSFMLVEDHPLDASSLFSDVGVPTESPSLIKTSGEEEDAAELLDQSESLLALGQLMEALETSNRAVTLSRQLYGIPEPVSNTEPTSDLCTCADEAIPPIETESRFGWRYEYCYASMFEDLSSSICWDPLTGSMPAVALASPGPEEKNPDTLGAPIPVKWSAAGSFTTLSRGLYGLEARNVNKYLDPLTGWKSQLFPPINHLGKLMEATMQSTTRCLAKGQGIGDDNFDPPANPFTDKHSDTPINLTSRILIRYQDAAKLMGATMHLLMPSLFTKGQELSDADLDTLADIKCCESHLGKCMMQSTKFSAN